MFNSTNINDVYKNFTDVFTQHVNQHIPKKVVVIRPSDKPFMTNAIKRKMRQRNRIHYKAKKTNSDYQWNKYRCLRNQVIDMVRTEKKTSISRNLHHKY